jgi:fatty-acyl-CoA synthase
LAPSGADVRRNEDVADRLAYMPSNEVLAAGVSTIGQLFAARARLSGNAVAVEEGERRLTYGELDERANRLANALAAAGLIHGDRVGLYARNCTEYLEIELAAAKLGVITAALNCRLAPAELEHCINLVSPRIIIAHDDLAQGLGALDLSAHRLICLGTDYETLLAAADARPPTVAVAPEDGLVILYTSGTTGLPKGAMISHRAMIARALVFTSELSLTPADGFVAWAPFYHMASTDHALATLLRGGKVIVVDGYRAEPLIAAAQNERIGWFVLIPGMIEDFIAKVKAVPGFKPKGIRVCGAMADLVPPHQIGEVTGLLATTYLNSFGSTETGLPPASRGEIPIGVTPTSLSKQQTAFCEIRLVDPHDKDVADGEPGELAIRGPTVFSGYWRADDTNAHDFRGGWFHLGDVFRRNPDGTLDFVDRAKYMIKSGGENVYPAEIERVLLADPRVADAAVVKVRDDKWGEAPLAFVARNDDALSVDDLMDRCRAELAGYKRPREIRFIAFEDIPRSTSGKIQRHELEKSLAE